MDIIKYIKKDWPMIPVSIFIIAGCLSPFIDIIPYENKEFHGLMRVFGGILLLVGLFITIRVRIQLVDKGNFPSFQATKALRIVKDQRLITSGMFRYIRHPLYLGMTFIFFGLVVIFSSLSGIVLIALGVLFLLPRIQIEERMLVEEFGDAYKKYQNASWRLIPFIF